MALAGTPEAPVRSRIYGLGTCHGAAAVRVPAEVVLVGRRRQKRTSRAKVVNLVVAIRLGICIHTEFGHVDHSPGCFSPRVGTGCDTDGSAILQLPPPSHPSRRGSDAVAPPGAVDRRPPLSASSALRSLNNE